MKVKLDELVCEANAVCMGLAPEVFEVDDDDQLHIEGNAISYTERLASARRVRPVVRGALPPAGHLPGDDMG